MFYFFLSKMSAFKCIFSSFFKLWTPNIFKYSFKIEPQIYSNIHS